MSDVASETNAYKDTLYLTQDIKARLLEELPKHGNEHGLKSHWARVGINLVLDALNGRTDSMQSRLMRLTGKQWKIEEVKT